MNQSRAVGVFENATSFLAAGHECRERGFDVVDAFTPYPMHEVEHLLGLKTTRLPWVTLIGGLSGLSLGLWFQYWSSATSFPLNVGGKPWDSLPAFLVVGFEMTILFAGVSTVIALLLRSGLIPGKSPKRLIEKVTDDRFALVVKRSSSAREWVPASDIFLAHGAVDHWSEEG